MAKAKKLAAEKVAKLTPVSSNASTTIDKENQPQNSQTTFSSRNTKGATATKKTPRSLSKKANLVLPAFMILKKLKRGNYADKIQKGAGIYCTAVIEYLVAEIIELAGNAASDNKKKRIIPRHITLAIRNDEELNKLLNGVTIAQGGVLPNIHSVLLPKKTAKRKSEEK